MKKILIVIIFLIGFSGIANSQNQYLNLLKANKVRITDSLNVLGTKTYFGTNGHIFSFGLTSGARALFTKNGSVDLLDFDCDNDYWTFYKSILTNGDINITGAYKVNGVPISSSMDTNHYHTIYNLDTNKLFYRRDTTKYYNKYNLDTSNIAFLSQTNIFTKYNTFDSLQATRIIISGDGFYMPDATGVTWRTSPGMSIIAQINEIVFNAHKFSYYTQSGTRISEVDSTTGIYCSRGMDIDGNANVDGNVTIGGFTTFGGSGGTFKTKMLKGKLGSGTNQNYQFAHSLTFKDITDFSVVIRNDSTVGGAIKFAKPQSWFTNYSYYANIDSLYLNITLPAASNFINDSMFCTITYRP